MAQLTKLKLSIKTGSEPFSGTNARIYLAPVCAARITPGTSG